MSAVRAAQSEAARAAPPASAPARAPRAASLRAAAARSGLWRRELLFVAAALVFVVDQYTKRLAVQHLWPLGSLPLLGPLHLTYVENRGAAFGLLQNQTLFFVIVGLVVIGGLTLSYRYLPSVSPLLNVCLGLQLGGALGNLVDRLRQGYVVDFVDLTWWPVFNVADAAIVVGVCVMAYYLVRGPRPASAAHHA